MLSNRLIPTVEQLQNGESFKLKRGNKELRNSYCILVQILEFKQYQNANKGCMNLSIFFPNIAKTNHKDATKAKILVYILLFTLASNLCLTVNAKIGVLNSSFPFWSLTAATASLLVIFRFTDSLTITTNLFLAIFAYLLAYTSLESGGIYSLDNFLLYIIPFGAYVLSEVRSAVFWLIMVNSWSFYLFTLVGSPEQIQFYRDHTLLSLIHI